MRILFQGDSITDAGRNKQAQDQPSELSALGPGYAGRAAGKLLALQPDAGHEVFNRGISGNRVTDLYARWRRDALNLKPDLISILIGINNIWHHFGSNDGVNSARFEHLYRLLLEDTRAELPDTRLVLCTPFVTPCGAVGDEWPPVVAKRAAIVHNLALAFEAQVIDFRGAFECWLNDAPAAYWAQDGVHPTPAGHERMAELWIDSVFEN